MTTKDYTIPAKLLGTLGTLWGGKPTAISPFRYGESAEIRAEAQAALIAAGICDNDGRIVPGIRPALDILGTAEAFTRMYLSGGPNPQEFLVYFGQDGNSVSMINVRGDFRIIYPSRPDLFADMAVQTIGSTLFRNAPFDASVSYDEALVFCALIDLQRKALLHSVADSSEVKIAKATAGEISTALNGKDTDYQWLGIIMMSLLEQKAQPSPDRIGAALASLEGKGLVGKTGTSWHLSDAGVLLARRMLIIDTSLVLTAGFEEKSGNVSIAGFTCVQAGVHDLLLIDAGETSVDIQSVSSAGVIEYVQKFFADASIHRNLAAPEAKAPKTLKFCPQCGASLKEELKFCSNCGYKKP